MKKSIIILTGILCCIGIMLMGKTASAAMYADNCPVYGYVDGKLVTGNLSYSNSVASASTKHLMTSTKTARVYGVYMDIYGDYHEVDGGESVSMTTANAVSSVAIPNSAYHFVGARGFHSAYYVGYWSSPSKKGTQKP